MSGIILRIFSGFHLGAEIELINGTTVLGSDDSCDIILNDSSLAERHAALRITADSGIPAVEVQALDGSVLIDGVAHTEAVQIPPARPFQLAAVCLAWAQADTDQAEAWTRVEAALTERYKRQESTALGNPPPEETAETGGGQAGTTAVPNEDLPPPENNASEGSGLSDEGKGIPLKKRSAFSHFFKAAVPITALVLIGLLCFSWKPPRSTVDREAAVLALLHDAGYDNLTAVEWLDGVSVSGRIASDSERGRLLRLAQGLDFPVYLNLSVHSDAADAVRASYNAMGLYPDVTELPPSPKRGISVRGYIRDGILEEQALESARRNVPELAAKEGEEKAELEIFTEIRHMDDVSICLEPALAAERLRSSVSVDYLPGRVLLRGALTPKTKSTLSDIAADVQQRLGIPVPIDIINTAEAAAEPEAGAVPIQPKKDETHASVQQEKPQQHPAPPTADTRRVERFRVTSVSMGPMKYITLENGERVFEGGELPGGYIVEGIGVDELVLSKNNNKTIYPLRGGND